MFFKKKVPILNPFEGEVIPLDNVPDPVFSGRLVGDGVAVVPTNNQCLSPVEGTVVSVFPTKHAVMLRTKEGLEIMVHIGLDTVSLEGEGFESHVAADQTVKAGQLLITFDRERIGADKSLISPVIVTNLKDKKARIDPGEGNKLFTVVVG